MDQAHDSNRSLEHNANCQLGGGIGQEKDRKINFKLALTFITDLYTHLNGLLNWCITRTVLSICKNFPYYFSPHLQVTPI